MAEKNRHMLNDILWGICLAVGIFLLIKFFFIPFWLSFTTDVSFEEAIQALL